MIRKQIQKLVVFFLVSIITLPSLASALKGELEYGLGCEWDSDNLKAVRTSTETGFHIAFEDNVDGGRVHLSARAWREWIEQTGKIGIDQLWFRGYLGNVDYTGGKQVISWGTADGFNPTNYFSRLSSSALFSGDLRGEPIWAGQATYYGSNWSVTGVVIPAFSPQVIDGQMRKMMLASDPQAEVLLVALDATAKPDGFGTNTEWALRAETQLGGIDMQASFFAGYEPLPGLEMVVTVHPELGIPVAVELEGKYRKQYFGGLATTGTFGPVGFWSELTYGGPKPFEESTSALEIRQPLSINKKYLQAVVGGDYTLPLGKGLLVQGQYIYRGQGSLFTPYVTSDEEIKAAHYLYGRLGYDLSLDSSVDLVVLHGTQEKSGLIRPAYTLRLPSSIQLELSAVKTYGDGEISSVPFQWRLAVIFKF
ncbi:MAG: hypothetical protein PHD88_06815 [Firmicutes bacterium]|nr:hypothetical protein [Bacillota bacterium]MDD4264465.1 hypothetical protein [Bacillota bacterium]MDD4694092.1 hypothetical protein [Bacillota bacterium]